MMPANETELAEAVRDAAGPLEIRGGGSRAGLGKEVDGSLLSTGKLTGIRLYEPGALTLVVKAGTPLSEVEATLAEKGQRLPFEPMRLGPIYGSAGEPTIGGAVATSAAGPRRVQAGGLRDSLIGVRYVSGLGEIVKNGGRVMKNVTGYDLVKLMAGSHGTLGVITEASFKLLPKPEKTATLILHGLDIESAGKAMRSAMASPYDVTGAAHWPAGPNGEPQTLIRVEGFAASIKYRITQLSERLAHFGAEKTMNDDPTLWDQVRDVTVLPQEGYLWRISVKPTSGPSIAARLPMGRPFGLAYDWAGGLVWLQSDEQTLGNLAGEGDAAPGDAISGAEKLTSDLRKFVADEGGGHVTLIRAPEAARAKIPVFHPEPEVVARLSAGLRQKFDPKGILNPGRMG